MSLTVNELAVKTGTTPHAVRYYSRMGLLNPERHPKNGYRLFKQTEVSWLMFVQQAKNLGFTLAEIKEIKHDADEDNSPCPRVREILESRIVENRKQLDDMERLQTRMEKALKQWGEMPDGMPDGQTVCHLIESIQDDCSNNH